MMRHTTGWMLALAAAGITAACGGDTTTDSTSNTGTEIQALPSLAFTPSLVGVPVGGTVTWVFGSVGHTVTFDAAAGVPANIGTVDAPNVNVSLSRTFTTAGTYTFHCSIHTFMTGTIVVGSSTPLPPAPPPPTPPPGYLSQPRS